MLWFRRVKPIIVVMLLVTGPVSGTLAAEPAETHDGFGRCSGRMLGTVALTHEEGEPLTGRSFEEVQRMTAAMKAALMAAAAVAGMAMAGGAETFAATPAATWRDAIEELKKEPGLAHLSIFSEGQGLQTRNLVDAAPFSEIVIAGKGFFAGSDSNHPRWVAGRWPGKPALSIGTMKSSIGRTHFYGVDGKDFTVEVWVRTPPDAGRMVFASVGDGYSHGWRLNSSDRGLEFVLGRKPGTGPGEGMVVVHAQDCLRPGRWQQIVATLSSDKLRLYVDGKLAAEKTFDGVYRHTATPAARHQTPEIDFGGLQLGATAGQKSDGRFDIDELAIFSRALDAERVARLYASGNPEAAPEEQIPQFQVELARQIQLDAITLSLPTDTFGYFPNDQAIPVTVAVGKATMALFGKAGTVEFEVSRFQGESLAKVALPLAVGDGGLGKAAYTVAPDRCGLYVLGVTARDQAGQILKSFRVDFARRLPLPPRDKIPATSMFAWYVNAAEGMAMDVPTFGPKAMRIIQPVYGRAPDGGANFAASDALVDKANAMGMEVLYCIGLSFWDAGHYPTLDDWRANPKIHTDHVRTLATRYKGKVKYWEIFNEPNAHGFTPDDYVKLLQQAHTIFKEIDPEAKIVGPCGTSNYHDWTEEVLAAGGGPYLDILSLHNYLGSSPLKNLEMGRVAAVKASMRKHLGRELPMWNSECGLHQPARIDGRPATDEELLELYGSRARRDADGVKVGVDAICMINEHLRACWQAQSLLVERAEGVEKYFMLMRPSQPYPCFSPGNEGVTETGVALAAVQSLVVNAVEARFIPTGVKGVGGVALVERDGKTHAALFADTKVRLVFRTGLKAAATIRATDFLGNPVSFQADAAGLLPLDLAPEPVYLLDVPAAFAVNADGLTLRCGVRQPEPMSLVEVAAEVRNPFDREVSAKIVPDVSVGVAATAEREFALKPGETRRVGITWRTGPMNKGRHWLRAQLHLDGQFFSVVEKGDFLSPGKTTRMPRLAGAPPLDGDKAKWADIPAETGNTREQAVIGRPVEGAPNPAFWAGPQDLSYTFKTAWSDAGIHFLLEVTDSVLRPPATAAEEETPGGYDGLTLFLDARQRADRQADPTTGATRAWIAPRVSEAAAECPVRISGEQPLPVAVRCVGRKTALGYLIEGTIAPGAGGPSQLAAGTRINLDVAVDDNDDRPDQAVKLGRRVRMALHGTAGAQGDASDYGRYELSGEPPQVNLIPDGALRGAALSPADARGHADVPGWRLLGADKTDAVTKAKLFWGAKQVDGRNALWIGTGAEAHLETAWELAQPIPAKGGTGYSASCEVRGRVDGKAVWAHGNAIVIFLDAKGNWLGHHNLGGIDLQKTPDQWRPCTGSFITPAGTTSIGMRGSILSKGVDGFADYYWTGIEVREIPERAAATDAGVLDPEKGKHISRTMAALATSTAMERKPVRVLFYGQSITGQPWSHEIAKRLKDTYFRADFSYENRAIGGFGAERLVKTAKQDLYPFYPDLVIFHVYGGQNGEWEEIIREIRAKTTAEILVATHHLSHQGNAWVETEHGKESEMIRRIAAKYDCELADVREEWKRYLADNMLQVKDMLGDDIHLNDRGCELMAELIWKHLQYNPAFANPHGEWIKRIPVVPAADGSITVDFTGNRVDILAGVPLEKMGTAKLLLDGRPPSANPKAYALTRPSVAPGVWWPAVYTIGSEAPMPQAEEWTLTVTDVPAEGPVRFEVAGSKTGADGSGSSAERFVSDSKRIVIEPGDWGIDSAEKYTKTKCPVGFQIKWRVEPLCVDTYAPPAQFDPTRENATRVTQLIDNGPHTLTIIPNGDGPVPISAVRAYAPPVNETPEK
jgi:hypothetical protein